eukprot:scaffold22116_cov16-Prasinocladus_malaysianus.AAC.1
MASQMVKRRFFWVLRSDLIPFPFFHDFCVCGGMSAGRAAAGQPIYGRVSGGAGEASQSDGPNPAGAASDTDSHGDQRRARKRQPDSGEDSASSALSCANIKSLDKHIDYTYTFFGTLC